MRNEHTKAKPTKKMMRKTSPPDRPPLLVPSSLPGVPSVGTGTPPGHAYIVDQAKYMEPPPSLL